MKNDVIKYLPDLIEASFRNDNNSLENIIISMIRLLSKDKKNDKIVFKMREMLGDHQAGINDNIIRSQTVNMTNDEISPYYIKKIPTRLVNELILNDDTYNEIFNIILSFKNKEKLENMGIGYSKKIILSGSPGTGKSSIGESIANELGIGFLKVNVSSLFSSYLGDSGKVISDLFCKLESENSIILFDEFDSIGINRNLDNEIGEMRRIVNSLLTSLDDWNGKGIIIATTNSESKLDDAVLRRFDEIINIDLPDFSNRIKLFDLYTKNKLNNYELKIAAEFTEGYSPSYIENISLKSLRLNVIKKIPYFITIVDEIKINNLSIEKKKDIVKYLKSNYEKISTRKISELIGISKSSVQRYLKGE